jgi:hypothetical protein
VALPPGWLRLATSPCQPPRRRALQCIRAASSAILKVQNWRRNKNKSFSTDITLMISPWGMRGKGVGIGCLAAPIRCWAELVGTDTETAKATMLRGGDETSPGQKVAVLALATSPQRRLSGMGQQRLWRPFDRHVCCTQIAADFEFCLLSIAFIRRSRFRLRNRACPPSAYDSRTDVGCSRRRRSRAFPAVRVDNAAFQTRAHRRRLDRLP